MSHLKDLHRALDDLKGLAFAFAGMPEHFVAERRSALVARREAARVGLLEDLKADPFAYLEDPTVQARLEALKKHPHAGYKVGPSVDHWLIRMLPLRLTGFVYEDQWESGGEHDEGAMVPRPTYRVALDGQDLGAVVVASRPDVFDYRYGIDALDDRALHAHLEQHVESIREQLRANPYETQILMEAAGSLVDVLEAEVQHELRALVYVVNHLYWECENFEP